MTIRSEIDMLYEKMWSGSERAEHFRILLEHFIPFSRWKFLLREKGEDTLGSLIYFSPYIRLKITPDFEMYKGLGSVRFIYSRPNAPRSSREKKCWPWINSNPNSSPYFHLFLERIPAETMNNAADLPVKEAFAKLRTADDQLKELLDVEPAYSVAFEAFCWEYYGERMFRLFDPANQSERDAFEKYTYEYYSVRYSPETIEEWEEKRHLPPPWKLCL